MAYRAGVELRDMEFMQFHPTVLYMAGSARHLLTEALRGEGAYLRDKDGHRFMPDCHPLAELAPRDDVSLAIARQMARTHHPSVYLDLSHLDPEFIRRRFPGIDRLCQSFDLDITRDPIPVCPGAHYMIGGVTIDERAGPPFPACGPPAKFPARACTGPTGWPPTACSKAWSTGRGWPKTSSPSSNGRPVAA